MNARILDFRPRRIACRCGYKFVPLHPTHELCRECYRWSRIGLLIDTTRMQFQKLRDGGR